MKKFLKDDDSVVSALSVATQQTSNGRLVTGRGIDYYRKKNSPNIGKKARMNGTLSPTSTLRSFGSPGRDNFDTDSIETSRKLGTIGSTGSMTSLGGSTTKMRGSMSSFNKFTNTNKDPKVIALRRNVILGDFMNGFNDSKGEFKSTNSQWKFKQWQMLVFISSTFTDTRLERNILLDDILPELRDEAIQHDIEVTFVDMRWGIRDEHTLKHRTWLECQKELKRCKDESCGLFFLSLQSQKYGYMPLPRTIDKYAFERAIAANTKEIKLLADMWFQYDENSIPPHYVLRDLESLDDASFWENALPKLRDAFMGIRFDKTMATSVILGRSISEWEAKFSLITDEDAARSMWVHRSFNGRVENGKFADTTQDAPTNTKLKDLKKWINGKIRKAAPQRIHNYSDISLDSYLSEHNNDFLDYTTSMKINTLSAMQVELRNIISVKEEFDANGCNMNLPGYLLEEFLHHANWAHDLCASFISREGLVEKGLEMALKPNQKFEDSRAVVARTLLNGGKVLKYKALSFVVMGAPGVGKSAYMAKIANELFNLNKEAAAAADAADKNKSASNGRLGGRKKATLAPTIPPSKLLLIRFCGTGGGTTSTFSLIAGLVSQIEYSLDQSTPPLQRSKMSTFRRFRELVKDRPLLIIIDSIDKIVGGVEIFENLSIHHDTRIIVSVTRMRDDSNMTLFAMDNDVPCLEVEKLTTTTSRPSGEDAETAVIVDEYLRRKSRKLSIPQRGLVLEKLNSDPRAIYLSLVLREVEKWQSFDNLENLVLEEFTGGVMCQILDKVELDCGELMSRLAIGCLTLSVNGINDIEMEDVLSLNKGVMYAVFQYDYPKLWRLPSHVWLRLRNSLIGLIVERQRGCLHWHHEELQSIALHRFSSPEEKENIHRTLGIYFSNRVEPDIRLKGRILSQPLCINGISPFLSGANFNTRRYNEGAHHLIEGGLYNEAVDEMCNLEYASACILSDEGYGLISRLERLAKHFESVKFPNTDIAKRVNDYYNWVSTKFESISKDSPILMLTVTASMEPTTSCVYLDYLRLWKSTKMDIESNKYSDSSWVRGMTLHSSEKGFKDPSYKTYNSCIVWTPDSSRVATCSGIQNVDIWDVKSVSVVGNVTCPGKHPILQMSWAYDGKLLATSTRVEVFIWCCEFPDKKHATLIKTLGVSSDRTQVGRFSPTALELCCGSPNRKITLWGGGIDFTLQETYTISKGSSKYGKQKVAVPDICEINWSSDGQILSGLTVGNLRIWQKADTVPKATFTPAHGSRITSSDFSPDGNRIATTSEDGSVTIWNTFTTAKHSVFEKHRTAVTCISWHKDGSLIASGSKDGMVLVWNVLTGEVVQHLFGHYHEIVTVSWSPSGLELVSSSSNDHYILWDSTKNGGKVI